MLEKVSELGVRLFDYSVGSELVLPPKPKEYEITHHWKFQWCIFYKWVGVTSLLVSILVAYVVGMLEAGITDDLIIGTMGMLVGILLILISLVGYEGKLIERWYTSKVKEK